jgi:ATP-dependent Clp protease ATP-binding subunit ClpA
MFERFTSEARGAVVAAQQHARRLNHCWIGTEHILLALAGGHGVAAGVLRDLGLDHDRLEHGIITVLGGAAGADAAALEAIGIDLDAVRRRVEETFGPGALERTWAARPRRGGRGGHVPFTRRAKKALELSLRESLALRHRYIGTEHLLLGLIRDGTSLAAQVLYDLGIERAMIRQRVLDALTGEADSA